MFLNLFDVKGGERLTHVADVVAVQEVVNSCDATGLGCEEQRPVRNALRSRQGDLAGQCDGRRQCDALHGAALNTMAGAISHQLAGG